MSYKTLSVLIFLAYLASAKSYCFVDDKDPYLYFGSQTSYNVVRGVDSATQSPSTCYPTFVWGLIRHGTRYSSALNATELKGLKKAIVSNHELKKRGSLCKKDLENLKKWESTWSGKTQDDLAPQGQNEMLSLAKQLKSAIFQFKSKHKFKFQSSSQQRTQNSAKIFARELLGMDHEVIINDTFLRFLEQSADYQYEVLENADTYKEEELFLNTEFMNNLIKEVCERLGYDELLPLESIKQMYRVCAFEYAWMPKSTPAFCAAFLRRHLQILEFLDNLHDYYELGYGSAFNIEVPNPVYEDLISQVIKASNRNESKGIFYFSHSATLVQTIVKMNLYYDEEPLRHDSFDGGKTKFKWLMSKISPFGGNLIAVLWRCNEEVDNQIVTLYHNEDLVKYSGCPTGLCTLTEFLQAFQVDAADNGAVKDISILPVYILLYYVLQIIGNYTKIIIID